MSEVLILTGAGGFLGSHVFRLSREQLGKRFETLVSVDRFEQCTCYSKDGSKKLPLERLKEITGGRKKSFIHLATAYIPVPETFVSLHSLIQANILFGSRVLDAVEGVSKMINIKSYLELLPACSQNEYSLTKLIFSKYCKTRKVPLTEIVIFDTFGLNDKREKAVSKFIECIKEGKQITIPRNDIHINLTEGSIVASAIIKALDEPCGIYAAKNKNDITLEKLINILEMQLIKKARVKRTLRRTDKMRCLGKLPKNLISYDDKNLFRDLKLQTK